MGIRQVYSEGIRLNGIFLHYINLFGTNRDCRLIIIIRNKWLTHWWRMCY